MQSNSKKIIRFIQTWVIDTLAVMVTVIILRGHIRYEEKLENLLIASFLLGILNAFVRPVLRLIAAPIIILTLGLFSFVINALLLCFLGVLLPFFHVDSFGYAFLGALVISIISAFLNVITGNARISVKKGGPPKNPGGGNGPVIDV